VGGWDWVVGGYDGGSSDILITKTKTQKVNLSKTLTKTKTEKSTN